MRDVVDGNSSAVPIGTRGMTAARAQSSWARIQQQPDAQKQGPDPHGPALAQPVHDRAQQHAPHHQREHADVGEDRPDRLLVEPELAPEIQRQHRGHGGERHHPDPVDPDQPRRPGCPGWRTTSQAGARPAGAAAPRPSCAGRDSGSQRQANNTFTSAERRRHEARRRVARGERRTSRSPGPSMTPAAVAAESQPSARARSFGSTVSAT